MSPELHPDLTPLSFLLGTWRGGGRGMYPTVDPFLYDEEVVVEHVGDPFLLYRQSSWLTQGRTPLHFERGFIRPGDAPDQVELCLAHPIGVTEVAHGSIDGRFLQTSTERQGAIDRTRTGSSVTAVTRTYHVVGDTLTYELFMATERTPITIHLRGELRRLV